MNLVYIDFETFWSKDHSLTKMPPLAYVMHPDTEIISCAIKVNNFPTDVFFGEERIRKVLHKLDWSDKMVIGHNMSGFDAMILAWRFGINPKMWGCTLAMARPLHAKTCGLSLAKLVNHYQLGVKDNTALVNTQGKRLKDFTEAELDAMRDYNRADTEQCAALFKKLAKHYDAKELWQIDATIRMLVEPQFQVDASMLETALSIERDQKLKALLDLHKLLRKNDESDESIDDPEEYVRSMMASAPRFADLLTKRGVPVPMKPSPTNPENSVPALAKTDEAFLKLQEHKDPLVAMAARTRLSVKSTILETRIEAFLEAAKATDGKLPVPLHYCGADTTGRWSGFLYNPQNLPRIIVGKPKTSDALRNSMKAPEGKVIVVADLSGIELRVNHFLWQVPSSMRLFKEDPAKADLYKDFAARLYDIEEAEVTKEQRQIGKIAHLGLGFGAGPGTFQRIAKMMGGVDMPEVEATQVTYKWRDEYAPIVEGWKQCHKALPFIVTGDEIEIDPWGLARTCAEGIRLPSGRIIRYPMLRNEAGNKGPEWFYGDGRHKARIYAGKITENIVQALARDVIAGNALSMFKATKLRPSLMVHDELVYVVPEAEAQAALDTLQGIMRTPPTWWPQLVTWSEGDVAHSYGAAK